MQVDTLNRRSTLGFAPNRHIERLRTDTMTTANALFFHANGMKAARDSFTIEADSFRILNIRACDRPATRQPVSRA
jgi:hypothetical protein